MQKFKTLNDAVALATYAHRHQLDKAGEPYIEHPLRVLETVKAQGVQPYVQIAAVMHDVTEDTAFTSDILLALGFSEAAVRLVRLLDRDHSENRYNDEREKGSIGCTKDEFYYLNIKASRGATIIKLADIRDNLSPWRLSYLQPETQERLRNKYAKALEILNPAPTNHGFINTFSEPLHDPYHLR